MSGYGEGRLPGTDSARCRPGRVRKHVDRRRRHRRRVGEARPGRHQRRRTAGSRCSKALFVAAVCQTAFYLGDLYNLRIVSDRREMFIRMVQGLGITSLILGVIYFWFPG